MGSTSTTFYEFFIGLYAYEDPPRVAEVRRQGRQVVLLFTKRLDPASAGNPSHYELNEIDSEQLATSGSTKPGTIGVTEAKVDGSAVILTLKGVKPGRLYELKAKEISDAADRRLIGTQSPTVLKSQTVRFRH